MNRYPLWKYITIAVVLLLGMVYSLPNLFGEAPAVQVSSGKATVKVDSTVLARVEAALAEAQLQPTALQLDGGSVRARFADTDTQLKARDALEKAVNPDANNPSYVVALNLVPRTPTWLQALNA